MGGGVVRRVHGCRQCRCTAGVCVCFKVDSGEGHTGRRVMRRSPRLQACDGGPDARRGERGAMARTGVGPGSLGRA